jgi:hypothetical protein
MTRIGTGGLTPRIWYFMSMQTTMSWSRAGPALR